MQVQLKNVGIINKANVKVEGLTVLAGQYGSGKTTFCRALNSVLSNIYGYSKKFNCYSEYCDIDMLTSLIKGLNVYNALMGTWDIEPSIRESIGCEYPFIYSLRSDTNITVRWPMELIDDMEDLYADVSSINHIDISGNTTPAEDAIVTLIKGLYGHYEDEFLSSFKKAVGADLRTIRAFKKSLFALSTVQSYLRYHIQEGLDMTFGFGGIQNMYYNTPARIVLKSDKNQFKLEISDNTINRFRKLPEWLQGVKAIYVDEQTVHEFAEDSYLFDDDLIKALPDLASIFDEVLPGGFCDGRYMVNGKKLFLNKLSYTLQVFTYLRYLVESGLNADTIIILDDPEIHMHPVFQNLLGKLLVAMIKEFSIKVVVTTNSSNFLAALDAMSKEYNITDRTNFYTGALVNDGGFKLISVHPSKIYEDFLKPFVAMDVILDRYGYEEDCEEDCE